ncbi:MAG: PHP domain-containing protein [bacterium]
MPPAELSFWFRDHFRVAGGKPEIISLPAVEGHVHTDFTDGLSAAEECAARAADLDLEVITFTEHVRKNAPWFEDYFSEINRLKKHYSDRMKILCGVEARITDAGGTLDADEHMLRRADIVVASVHSLPPPGGAIEDLLIVRDAAETLHCEWDLLRGAMGNPAVDVIGHPFGAYHERYGDPPPTHARMLIAAAARAGKTLEINPRHTSVLWLIERGLDSGMDFLFLPASDAHHARDVGLAHREITRLIDERRRENPSTPRSPQPTVALEDTPKNVHPEPFPDSRNKPRTRHRPYDIK